MNNYKKSFDISNSSFYQNYKLEFIKIFSPLLLLDNSKVRLESLVDDLESFILDQPQFELDTGVLNLFMVGIINNIQNRQDAQVFMEFYSKFYNHFTELMRLYSMVLGKKKVLKYTFRFRLYLKLLADINCVFDKYTQNQKGVKCPK